MAIFTRYQETTRGALTITGNTLGTAGGAFGEGIINFTVSNPPLPPYGNSTKVWQDNSSTAYLNLPIGSTVLYAELSWSGQFVDSTANDLNTPIKFTSPTSSYIVSPDLAVSQTLTIPVGTFYERTQDVTDIVSEGGTGYYTIGGVPGFLSGGNNYLGWCLMVAFSLNTFPIRNLTIWTMLEGVSGGLGNVDITVSNFSTPPSGDVFGRLMVSTGGGNPNLTGDFLQFGSSLATLEFLSGPNNPVNNFYCSQINIGNSLDPNVGMINTNGTFGTWNSIPPNEASFGDRNSFDITNVNALGLTNNQTTGYIRFGTTDDTYQPIALALQVDVNSPVINPVKSAPKFAKIGDTITFTVTFGNIGSSDALNTVFYDTVPTGTTFITDSLLYNGVTQSGVNPTPILGGFTIGTIPVNAVGTISFKVLVTTLPSVNPILNKSILTYSYSPGVGSADINSYQSSNTTRTLVEFASLQQSKSVNKAYSDVNSSIQYSIVLKNTGNVSLINILFIDTIPTDTNYLPNTFVFNNVTIPNANPTTGVTLPSGLNVNQASTITFLVFIPTIPNPNPIINKSFSTASYIFSSPPTVTNTVTSDSNTVSTFVSSAILSTFNKYTNKSFASCGDTIQYTMVAKNTGNATAYNVVITDTTPNGTIYIPNSLVVDGVSYPNGVLSTGVTIPNIPPGVTSTLTYGVIISC